MGEVDELHGLIREKLDILSLRSDGTSKRLGVYAETADGLADDEALDDLAYKLAIELAIEVDVKAYAKRDEKK